MRARVLPCECRTRYCLANAWTPERPPAITVSLIAVAPTTLMISGAPRAYRLGELREQAGSGRAQSEL